MENKPEKHKKGSFFDLKPWDWGKGNGIASMEIDAALYGSGRFRKISLARVQ